MINRRSEQELSVLRIKLDGINVELSRLLLKRFDLLDEILQIKINDGLPLRDSQRVQEMLHELVAVCPPEKQNYISTIFSDLFETSLAYMVEQQKKLR
jgi:chorismate mutase